MYQFKIAEKKFVCDSWKQVREAIQKLDSEVSDEQLVEFFETFDQALSGRHPISHYFSQLSTGSFKDVYQVADFGDNWVLKICTPPNNTVEEMAALGYAADYGVLELFTPTIFFQLKESDSARLAQKNDFIASEFKSGDELWIQLQPIVTSAADRGETYWNKERKREFEAEFGAGHLFLAASRELEAPLDWLKAVFDYYGEEFFMDFIQFCKAVGLEDLHQGNVGYTQYNQPVIFDWISDTPDFC